MSNVLQSPHLFSHGTILFHIKPEDFSTLYFLRLVAFTRERIHVWCDSSVSLQSLKALLYEVCKFLIMCPGGVSAKFETQDISGRNIAIKNVTFGINLSFLTGIVLFESKNKGYFWWKH